MTNLVVFQLPLFTWEGINESMNLYMDFECFDLHFYRTTQMLMSFLTKLGAGVDLHLI